MWEQGANRTFLTPFDGMLVSQAEAVFAEALRLRCSRIDVFFMIGLPGQSLESVRGTVDYCERLF